MQSCPEDGISLQKYSLSEQVSCASEDAVRQLWAVAAGDAAVFHEAGKRTGCTGCFVWELAGICWINSEGLAAWLGTDCKGSSEWSHTRAHSNPTQR